MFRTCDISFSIILLLSSSAIADLQTPSAPSIKLLEKLPIITEVAPKKDPSQLVHVENRQEYMQMAIEYEQYFFEHFDTFKTNTDVFYTNSTSGNLDSYWTKQGTGSASTGYGGLAGVRLYHLYDEMFALGRMLRMSYELGSDHSAEYKLFAVKYIRDYVPALANGAGTQYCGDASSRFYCNASPPAHRFLDATRGLAWLGFLMESVLIADDSYRDEFRQLAQDLRPTLDRFVSRASNPSVAHMASHPALGVYAMGEIGGYLSDYESRIKDAINDAILGNIAKSGWVGSDVGHAEMSINFMHYVYEKQLRGDVVPGAKEVTTSTLDDIGPVFISKIDDPNPTAIKFEGNIVGEYGLLAKHSSSIRSKAGSSPSVYKINSPSGSHSVTEPLSSVASIAYGYFLK